VQVLGPLLFALLAAVGNGFFAFGQRKSAGVETVLAALATVGLYSYGNSLR
jgi:hypothetical protein